MLLVQAKLFPKGWRKVVKIEIFRETFCIAKGIRSESNDFLLFLGQ